MDGVTRRSERQTQARSHANKGAPGLAAAKARVSGEEGDSGILPLPLLRFGESAPPREEKMKKKRETEGGRQRQAYLSACGGRYF